MSTTDPTIRPRAKSLVRASQAKAIREAAARDRNRRFRNPTEAETVESTFYVRRVS
jgi:hypothetical protein